MQNSLIDAKILETFIKCDIKSFPVDCAYIVKHLGYRLYKYSELSEEKRNSCLLVSDESLKLFDSIYYNDHMLPLRIRFSIAHELGHILLDHGDYQDVEKEAEANYFASHFLAPRMAIHYSCCKNQNDVAKLFRISQEAARYAFDDYRRWYRRTITHKMTRFDKSMYAHFYNTDSECFVYSIQKCENCGVEIYNEPYITCKKCKKITFINFGEDRELIAMENHWLYGSL